MPKVGKTNLFTAMLAAWASGEGQFLGRDLCGPCPPIVIAGPDMNDGDWYLPLQRVGLVAEDGTIRDPIKAMFTAKHRFALTPEGIEKLVELAILWPGFVLLLDSYHAAIHGMGITEKDEAIADPLLDLTQALAPYNCTIIVVHHSGKTDAEGDPVRAARGNTALTGVPSMVINLSRKGSDNPLKPSDTKITLKASGRCAQPANLIIEQTENGWVTHGHADQLDVIQYVEEKVDDLTDNQESVLKAVTEEWQKTGSGIGNHWVARTFGKDTKAANKILRALEKKGLLCPAGNAQAQGSGGRERNLFKPHPAVIPMYPFHGRNGVNGVIGFNACLGDKQRTQGTQPAQLSDDGGASNFPAEIDSDQPQQAYLPDWAEPPKPRRYNSQPL